jgi:hypothetical protein
MKAGEEFSLEQIQALLEASDEVGFKGRNRGGGVRLGEPDVVFSIGTRS